MKNNLFKLFALFFIVGLCVACNNDDDNANLSPQIDDVVGLYRGNMKVTVGSDNMSLPNVPVTVSKVSENEVELTLKNLDAIEEVMTDVSVVCSVSNDGNDLNLVGTGSGVINGSKIDVYVTGDIDNNSLDVDFNFSTDKLGSVTADYNGIKQ